MIKIVEINQKSVEFFEAESKENVIKNMLFYFNEESLEVFREELIVLAEGGKRFECEMPIRILSGDIKTLDMLLSVVKGFEDTLSNVLVSFIDITERKQTESALRESEEKFRAIFEGNSSAIAIIEPDTTITMVNDAYCQMGGYNRGEIIGTSWTKQIPPEDLERLKEYNRRRLLNPDDAPDKYEFKFYRKDGDVRNALMSINTIPSIQKVIASFIDITDRKQKELVLQESEQRLKFHFENSPLAVVEWDSDYIVTQWSKEAEHIFGWQKEETIGKPIADLNIIFEEDMPIVNITMEKLSSGKENMVVSSNRNITKSGAIIECTWYNSVLNDEYGKMNSVMSLVQDITERKQYEETLRRNREQLSAVFNGVTETLILLDMEGNILAANKIAIERFNNGKGDFVGKNIYNIIPEPYDETRKEQMAELLRTKKPVHFQDNLGDNYLEVSFYPVFDVDCNVIQFISWALDITERKKSEEKLIRSREEWVETFNLIPDMITILDTKHRILSANKAATDKLGVSPGDIQGMYCYQCIHGMQGPPALCPHAMMLKDGKEHVTDIYEEKLGMDMQVSVTPIYDVNGAIRGSVHIARDITERKRFENVLKDKNAELVEINATKDKFFKIIAHDMKNPFISLIGASELLYENAQNYDGTKIATLTKILYDSAKSGFDMLLNLLDWSRSQAGSMIIQPEKINLKELIVKNHFNLTEYAVSKAINLNIDIANDLQVYADKNMLNTILRNFINNALKFTPKGGKVIVSTKNENGSIIIFVKDSGVGIDKSDFDKLFRNDIKFSNPGTEHESGTGLGLLLCKEFVEKQGGKIWVESEKGKGSTFSFSLGKQEVEV